jgi:LacI family transcriptional regulator
MAKFTSQLDEREIPYALLDSNWPEFNHRIFYGQDSLQSGAFSGHIMSLATDASTKKMALFKVLGEGRVASRQQMNREVGFRQYMEEHKPDIEIVDVNLYVYDKQGMREIMRDFFTENPDIRYALCFNSSIHIIADFLRTEMPDHPHVTLLGYDAVDANVECIKNGSADFLIAQHPQSQGLDCFRSMFNTCVLKMNIKRDHYMAIELLTKENIDFYKD